jgi:hypothetical protein
LFSAVKSQARGYRSKEYQIAMLCFIAGKLEIHYYVWLFITDYKRQGTIFVQSANKTTFCVVTEFP